MSTNQSTNETYPIGVFTSEFTGNELFLADHIIQGQKILPGMAYLEISRAAVANSITLSNNQMIVLEDSVFVQAILVSQKREVQAKVYPGATGEFGVEVITSQGVHFQTKALIQTKTEVRNKHNIPEVLNLDQLQKECNQLGPSKSIFYENMRKREVFLGASHQGIETIHIGNNTALVALSLPGSSERNMAMDPGMLDSIIQGGIALASNPEANVVPFAVKNTFVFGELTDTMVAYIEKKEEGMDYTVSDEHGEVKVVIKGFQAREIEIAAQEEQLVYYKATWEEVEETDEESHEHTTVIKAKNSYGELVKSVFSTVKKCIQEKTANHLIEVQLPKEQPSWKGIMGLLKTASIEYPKIEYKLTINNKPIQTVYTEAELSSSETYTWGTKKTILITGALGGVGKLICQDIAEKSDSCELILVGRSALNSDRQKFINALKAQGINTTYVSCDVSNEKEVNDLIKKHPHITGVIHCSGSNSDNLITKKTLEEIDEVLAPKVQGIQYLDKATSSLPLDYFVAFSSIAGALGNAGQADYAAANAYMDAYMTNRANRAIAKKCSGKSISVNWPLWESDGMQLDEETKRNLKEVFKIKPLPAKQGLIALHQILQSDAQQVVVLYGSKKNVKNLFTKPKKKKKVVKPEATVSATTTDVLQQEISQKVKEQVAGHLKRKIEQLDTTADWSEFGFDSILLSSFINKFNAEFNLNLLPTVLFEATNIDAFSQYLYENHASYFSSTSMSENQQKETQLPVEKEESEEDANSTPFARSFKQKYKNRNSYRDKDLAIVGMSCKIAGANNPEEFWEMLIGEKDMISEIPHDRWDWKDYPGISKWGSFVDDIAAFDPLFFGISPAEAIYMSPEQRLMIQYVWECMEDAGYAPDELRGTNTGLFMGCGPSSYVHLLSSMPVEAYSATGMVPSVGPNRISFLMDWHGPSNPIDTACSSSLVALHRAMEAINLGHCDQAFIGGVNALLTPDVYISFSKSGMLCEDGRCKTFSDKANGYVRGEGIGVLMVKKLKDAIKDGDHIYAVVKGTAENHGGHANSLTAPNPKSQAAVIKRALQDAEMDFSRVSYVECHGTGTPLGDPIEIEGLKMVAAERSKAANDTQECKLGSIKSNIGHLEYGAGVVGLLKVILQMKHQKIAKTLHCDAINPYIKLEGTPFKIAHQSSDWEHSSTQPRVAGVSSFGFGGVNAHIVLQEYVVPKSASVENETTKPQKMVFVVSANDSDGLVKYVSKYKTYIQSVEQNIETLERIAYTLQTGRAEMPERIAFVADSFADWEQQIDAFLNEHEVSSSGKIFRNSVYQKKNKNTQSVDATQREYIQQLVKENQHEKIAKLWTEGTAIDWEILYQN
ncbi:SDR family NAD(P)-dependent oxidoreductase [Kordia zhangzhouensis]|uniref:SDR family NAD(P)-dependent oxidoreductase n=1 Tax=Kordia zhangzhouensis TaxID=1620405 RepID=UPI0006291A7E|nr:SDR family NAD(P)-dependent oxidoreductase [Kordia zhangzhouensis]